MSAESTGAGGTAEGSAAAAAADGVAAQNGATAPVASQPEAPRAARPPDEDAIDLLSVAGFPVLKRALPVAGAVLVLLLLILGIRGKRRRG